MKNYWKGTSFSHDAFSLALERKRFHTYRTDALHPSFLLMKIINMMSELCYSEDVFPGNLKMENEPIHKN